MRWFVAAVLLASLDARADVSLPGAPSPSSSPSSSSSGGGDCGAIFAEARRSAAARDPRFAHARLEHDGPGRWDLTLQRSGLYASVAVFPLDLDARQDWLDLGDEQPIYVRWADRREGLVMLSGFSADVERPVRALFERAVDRCLAAAHE